MSEGLILATCLLLELGGLFAIWNWSRQSAGLKWLLLGSMAILVLVIAVGCFADDFTRPQSYLALPATYLLAGLLWSGLIDGFGIAGWGREEILIAMLAAGMSAVACS